MRCGRSLLLGLALAAFQLTPAVAQTQPQPWSGIAANEASRTNGWSQGSNDMAWHSISADGRFVLFHSNISTHVPNDNNGWNDVFLRDRVTGELTRVSVATDGAEGNNYSAWPAISADGRHIAFYSCASNFDGNAACGVFVRDRIAQTTTRQSIGPNGELPTQDSQHQFRLSGDGRYVVFNASFDSSTPWVHQAYLRDRDPDANGVFDEPGLTTTTLISESTVGQYQLGGVEDVAISNDGHYIAYVAITTDTATSTEIGQRVYVHDRVSAMTFRVDRPGFGVPEAVAFGSGPDFSDAGYLAYSTSAPLVETDTDTQDDVYVINLITGGNVLINVTQLDPAALTYVWAPAISADGRYVAVMTGELTPPWYNSAYNVYGVDRQTQQSYLVSVSPYGYAMNNTSAPSITADGSGIAFKAGAEMLINGWGNEGIFVAEAISITSSETEVPETGGTYTIDVTAPATTVWSLEPAALVNPSSGTGSATVQVTIPPNTSPDDTTIQIILGSEQVEFHQASPPRINYMWPWQAPTSGGTDVDIFGSGFAEGMTVEFGGTAATNVTFIDNGHIVATTPAHFGGWVSVKATKASGGSVELENMFMFEDQTPPIITPHVTGTIGANGWYTSDVTVTWTVVEDESTILANTCNETFSLTTDAELVFAICHVETEFGGSFSDTPIKRDTVPPNVWILPQPTEAFAQGQQVGIGLSCDDQTSGVNPVNCTANQAGPLLDTSTPGTFVLTATAVDMAGHTATTSVTYTVKMWTGLTVPVVTALYGDASALLRATLNGPSGPLAGKTITFFVDNDPIGTAITAANGEAVLNLSLAGRNAATYEMHAEYGGDGISFPAMLSSALTIWKAIPVITWANPAPIATTTPLGSAQLNATASVPGSFNYTPGFGVTLPAGTHSLNAYFTPQDLTNYTLATKDVTIKVKAVPVITWDTPAPIRYPQSLTSTQLNAAANVPGTFVYTPPLTWTFNAPGPQTLSVTFNPTNTADYVSTSATVVLEVLKGIPTINFPPSDSISYTAPLSATQLNATSQTPGTFTYSPPAGTILPAGTHTLTATFTPTDQTKWEITSATKSQVIYKATPAVRWDFPAPIAWGTPLGPQQQNATVNTPGTFTYYPPPGTILEIGQHWITVSFQPDDTANWTTGSSYASLTVNYASTTITWANPAPIVYGTSLTSTQLNATASVPGTITYWPAYGMILNAGTQTLTANFTPTDTAHYSGATKYVSIVVAKKTPTITWNTPTAIGYGTPLSITQLNASANASGSFTYTPAPGTVLGAGTHTLSVTFEPSDPSNNNGATATTTLVVNKATPIITWGVLNAITYGTPLPGSYLNATANQPGTFTYNYAAGAVLPAGVQTVTATFTPQDSSNFAVVSSNRSLTVFKATPVLSWDFPASITYGTPLSSTQLNATADIPGTFTYETPAGTILDAGQRTLRASFVPDDQANYETGSIFRLLSVIPATPAITWPSPAPIVYGTPLSATQLNATVGVPGTIIYTPALGTVLAAGTQQLRAFFTPESSNYTGNSLNVEFVVTRATPVVTWATPAPIMFGTALGAAQLNATADVPGTFTYSPAAGSLQLAGTRQLSVTFHPSDFGNYDTTTATVWIEVTKAVPVVTWANPAGIVYGAPLSGVQLNATAGLFGTFVYSPAAGTVLNAGTHELSVTFTPTDSYNYDAATATREIVVDTAYPVVEWPGALAPIVYGTPLTNAQLYATSATAGTIAYDPPAGTVLDAGTHTITMTFTPDDAANFNTVTAQKQITVARQTTTVTWNEPALIVYGTSLSAAQLNATASQAGTFTYDPPLGTVLSAGPHSLSVNFVPDSPNYSGGSGSVTLLVVKRTPAITWNNPAAIVYGTALSNAQLNASADVAGSFTYTPAAGAVLGAGSQLLVATFAPSDPANYNDASASTTIVVNKATPVMTWPDQGPITYGTALSASQLNATANVDGTFAYTPNFGAVLPVGNYTLSATFTPFDSANYESASDTALLAVGKQTAQVTWAAPPAITYGSALSSTELNATANVPGTFAYAPAAGTVLNAGTQQLSVTFTPADSANYNGATANVSIVVNKAASIVTWSNPAGITYGTALSGTQLNATANVPGTFNYSPAAGTVPGAGTQSLSVTFTPTDAANYNPSTGSASIVVAPVSLTVQTDNATKVYGAALPAFTASGIGFVNGDSMASLSGTLSFSTPATATSALGTYPVTPSGVSSANYTITFTNGTLTIIKASTALTLTTTPNPSTNDQQVQLRAVVSVVAPGAGTATGTVEFRENGTLLGTATLVNGVATLNKKFKRGTHPLTATYAGNTNFNGSSGGATHQTN